MSKVSVTTLKNRFEQLSSSQQSSEIDSLDITPIRVKSGLQTKFSRSVTCIDFGKLQLDAKTKEEPVKKKPKEDPAKLEFQRQLSNSSTSPYKSIIRRSPAFRFDAQNRPSVMKNETKKDPVNTKEFDELTYLRTSNTIKKALAKPLPTGSPPKKPPRLFQSPQFDKKVEAELTKIHKLKISSNTLPKKTVKTEEKKAISSFLNCIIAPCSIDPIYLEQIRNEQSRQRQEEETIYMEPYAHLKKDFVNNNQKNPKASEELHYMCTVLDPPPADTNGNVAKSESKELKIDSQDGADLQDYEKVKIKKIKKMFMFK